MKNSVAIILCLMCYLQAFALSPNTKMGKPTMEELQMNSYEPEPDANAVVLFRQTEVYFSYLATVGFRVVYNNKVRIKILTPEGVESADVAIPYCNPEGSTLRESIQDLKAASYNLENGKIVTSKLTNDLKHTERIDKKYCQQKFSIPNVKEGSVIEYQYSTHSDFFWQIDTWYAQQELPVFYTEYNIETPEWFTFHCEQSGYHPLITEESYDTYTILLGQNPLSCTSHIISMKAQELPSIQEDNYVWCIRDYCTKVSSELSHIDLPGSMRQTFTTHWDNIVSELMDDEDFGARFRMDNPLKSQQQAAASELAGLDVAGKVDYLRELLRKNCQWNKAYGLSSLSSRRIMSEEKMNSATLNFALMSMLRDEGITAYPVVLSRRSKGRIPHTHPSLNALNATVLWVETSDSTHLIVDAASAHDGFPYDQLPPDLMSDKGLVIFSKNSFNWVNLQESGSSGRTVGNVTAEITEDGQLKGHIAYMRTGEEAAMFRMAYKRHKDSLDYVETQATRNSIEVENWKAFNLTGTAQSMVEEFDFSRQLDAGEHLYFNPFLFFQGPSFKSEERDLPVEFAYPTNERLILTLTLPEGYEVEEMPKRSSLRMPDGGIVCTVMCNYTPEWRRINLMLNYKRTAWLYLPTDYPILRDFAQKIESMVGEMIVLKKKTE